MCIASVVRIIDVQNCCMLAQNLPSSQPPPPTPLCLMCLFSIGTHLTPHSARNGVAKKNQNTSIADTVHFEYTMIHRLIVEKLQSTSNRTCIHCIDMDMDRRSEDGGDITLIYSNDATAMPMPPAEREQNGIIIVVDTHDIFVSIQIHNEHTIKTTLSASKTLVSQSMV